MSRFYEMLPGILAWTTLVFMFLFSWLLPTWVSVFIILFDIYWFLKTVYLSLHLRVAFTEMRKNMKIDWLARLHALAAGEEPGRTAPDLKPEEVYHLVIFPMYDEPHAVVRESFLRLREAHYPMDRIIVVLAIEARAGEGAATTARKIEAEFAPSFHKFLVTMHPADLDGEIPGKGSNETWAGIRAKEALIDPFRIPYNRVLVSVFDVDTQIFREYFGRLTYVYLAAKDRVRAIYQPVPFFTNNIYEAPALARVTAFSTTFWQMMQQSRPERLTSFSSQSTPLQTLVDIGFWQKDIVSEDSRIFWQGFLRYHGEFRVEPLHYPLSMDANVAPTFWKTMKNLYKQQRRWGWGAENIPYMLDGFRRDPLIPRAKKRYWTFNVLEGFHSWATNSLMIFALGWLPLYLGGRHFGYSVLAYNLPRITRYIISFSMIGIVSSAVLSVLLLPPKSTGAPLSFGDYILYFFQWLLMPITLIIFGAFPGLEAQTRLMLGGRFRLGFWVTPKGRRELREFSPES